MEPLHRSSPVLPSLPDMIAATKKQAPNIEDDEIVKIYNELLTQELWSNDQYVVAINRDVEHGFAHGRSMFELTIRRQDREQGIPFRDVQAIKNQLVGDEAECVELYPAESRLVDTANQYWYYGFSDTDLRWPFGFQKRSVIDNLDFLHAKQTPRETD